MTETVSNMEVDTKAISRESSAYLESLEDPWKSIALRAIPPMAANNDDDALPSLASSSRRLDQLEVDVRSKLLELLQEDTKTYNYESVGNFWTSALNLCAHLVYHASSNIEKSSKKFIDPRYVDMAARKLPLLLLEDCLDVMSIQECQKLWTHYVEPSLDKILMGDLFWTTSSVCHLQFLRVCNQFLKILETSSESDDHEWKGRILCSLSKGFSIADRSALKLWGSFHTSNSNEFETKEEFEQDKEESSTMSMEYSLYRSFWSLQADFSNPNRIQLGDFLKKMNSVLEALETSASLSNASNPTPAASSIRYMTSSSLLPTQLSTSEFRSSVVSQFLIVAFHLSSESPALANALSGLLARARKLLKADNPQLYSILWDSILNGRENRWRQWKKEKCPPSAFAPKRKPEEVKETKNTKKKRSRLLDGPLGNHDDELAKTYGLLCKEELIQISQDLQKTVPTLEQHLEPYVEALDPESGIEFEYHPKNDPLYTWRAMRLFAKHQLPLLKHCRKPADLERMTRELYSAKGKDIPGEMPPLDPESDLESDVSDEKESERNETPGEQDIDMKDMGHREEEEDHDHVRSDDDDDAVKGDVSTDKESVSMPGPENDEHSLGYEERSRGNREERSPTKEEPENRGDYFKVREEVDDKEAEQVEFGDKNRSGNEALLKGAAESSENLREISVMDSAKNNHELNSNPTSRAQSDDDGEVDGSFGANRDETRRRSRSSSSDWGKPSSYAQRERLEDDNDRDRDWSRQPPRGGRQDEGLPPRGNRRDDSHSNRGGRRDEGLHPRGVRRDEVLSNRGGRRDEVPSSRGGRDDALPPRGGRGGDRFGEDRGRDDRHRGGGDRRRVGREGGREESRWRNRHR